MYLSDLFLPLVFTFAFVLSSLDSGRHLPRVSAAGALQLSWLSVRKDAFPLCAEAQTSQFAGQRSTPRKPGI